LQIVQELLHFAYSIAGGHPMTTPYEATVKEPEIGEPAPKFSLPAYPEGTISLDDFRGQKNVILAFYPKDDTPGCTREMCSFTEDLSNFESADTAVLGISCDSVKSHEAFAGKYSLKQPLLADEGGQVGRLYGTVRQGSATASRTLFVIDKNGTVQHVFHGMPTNAELLAVVRDLK
jgi:thioredoxin-dependent peroxiredoxin